MIRNSLSRFLYGRYGNDSLNLSLCGLYLLLYLLSAVGGGGILRWISLGIVWLFLFRALSRNLPKRRRENEQFLQLVSPVLQWLRLRRTMRRDKEHRYFKCPNCGQQLRVPRGKGKITVSCRGCGSSFEEKS